MDGEEELEVDGIEGYGKRARMVRGWKRGLGW